MTHDERRAAVLDAGIRSHYKHTGSAYTDEGEESRCYVCTAFSKKLGTASHLWERKDQPTRPAVIALCDDCHDVAFSASL